MTHRASAETRADLDAIWRNIVGADGGVDAADAVIETITERFLLLAQYPRAGRVRDDLRPGLRSFPAGEYLIIYTLDAEQAVILHILPARRDIPKLIRFEASDSWVPRGGNRSRMPDRQGRTMEDACPSI